MKGVSLTQQEFTIQQKKLTGMTESKLSCQLLDPLQFLICKTAEIVNMTQSPSPLEDQNVFR